MASWVQADSSSCLFSLIYQARPDKCKHLQEYSPHLGAHRWFNVFHFFLPPYGESMHYSHPAVFATFSAWSSSPLLSHLIQSTISSILPVNRCYYGRWSKTPLGLAIWYLCGWVVKVYSFNVVWRCGCRVHTYVWGLFLLRNAVRLSPSNFWSSWNSPAVIHSPVKSLWLLFTSSNHEKQLEKQHTNYSSFSSILFTTSIHIRRVSLSLAVELYRYLTEFSTSTQTQFNLGLQLLTGLQKWL